MMDEKIDKQITRTLNSMKKLKNMLEMPHDGQVLSETSKMASFHLRDEIGWLEGLHHLLKRV